MNEEIKEKILKYLNDNPDSKKRTLKVLDNKYCKYYTGVTLNYITYNLLKAEYKKSDVTKVLKELFLNKEIKALFCPDVKKVVFEPKNSQHWSFFGGYYDYSLEYFENYMNQFIKNE
jgi:hypothetical protein